MSNDRILLDQVLKQHRESRAPSLSESDFFELFVAEQVLKDYELSSEEIESGQLGGGNDGGLDAVYTLVNGELVQDDFDDSRAKKDIILELVLIQSKCSAGFQETPIERFITVSDDIFDLTRTTESMKSIYNDSAIQAIERFRKTYTDLASRFPRFEATFCYACKGEKPSPGIERKGEKLLRSVRERFSGAAVRIRFLGATELLALARTAPKTAFALALAENPVSSAKDVGFVALVRLVDFFKFITDERGKLHRQIFEANVRDYQGSTAVNDAIQQTLAGTLSEDFWWLNNGVTIVADKASLSAKTLTIENPQIVNGLQTSTEVFNYLKTANHDREHRTLLVRVIVPSDSASRDRIIKATNSQTNVLPASLRATDKIHRDIEEYFRPLGYFYDRRKNYYKNEGKPLDKIIGIPQLAQAVLAVVLAQPHQARARPSSLLRDDENYRRIYSSGYPIHLYFVCAVVLKRVEDFLRVYPLLSARHRNNVKFYVALHAVCARLGKWGASPSEIAGIDVGEIDLELLVPSTGAVENAYWDLGGDDQVAKGSALVSAVKHMFVPEEWSVDNLPI